MPVPRLVALDLPPGRDFVLAMCRVWDDGDAVLPIDPRLPISARVQLFRGLAPEEIVRRDGVRDPIGRGGTHPPLRDGDAVVIPTSGTTGEPKGAIHTHAGLAAHAAAVHKRLDVDPERDRWLACLPLTHVGGFGVVARALIDEVPLEVHPGFDALAVQAAAADGATLTSLVTTALDRIDPASFRWVVLGGSADRSERPGNVVHTYGLTETGGGVVYDGTPLDGVEVRVDPDGQIAVRGATLLRAYRDGTTPIDEVGWLRTGDIGQLDDGQLRVDGRVGDLIITGGENVWPAVVEAALADAPGVAHVAVASRADPEWGQRVVAFVVPAEGEPIPTLAALREHAREQLPAFAAPRELELLGELPRTALGKVRRDHLT
ncbi:MAG: AMP-binding protein [Acidimicrobiales bacterium]